MTVGFIYDGYPFAAISHLTSEEDDGKEILATCKIGTISTCGY